LYKVLSSLNAWFRETARSLGKAPLQKYRRCGQLGLKRLITTQVTNKLLFIGLLISLSNCVTIPKTNYEDRRINFKITEDFKIVETKTWKHNNATYIKIDRRDKGLYANFSVTWLPKKCDLDVELKNFVESLKETYADDNQNTPVFSEVKSTKFGKNDAKQIDYIVANDGPRIGSYTAYYCDGLTIIIGQHFTPESRAMADRCIKNIEQTFFCVGRGN
jgi:hypothetical protein